VSGRGAARGVYFPCAIDAEGNMRIDIEYCTA